MFANELAARMAGFLVSIGIPVQAQALPDGTFLPGISVHNGALLVDEARLRFPGDLLHEGGHLALMSPAQRAVANDAVEHDNEQASEAAVIAWSYAAALHLGIDTEVLFHDGGYHGRAQALRLSYQLGVYPGAGTLATLGLAYIGPDAGGARYPAMLKWLRE